MKYGKLRGVVPDSVYAELQEVTTRFQICTPLRLAHFLSQCAHESADFTRTSENLNYSAERLVKVFPKYFNAELAEEYARHPVAIASLVYADRMGNGDEYSQEGWQYRGRGYIQLTGKNNYKQFDQIVPENIVDNPDLVALQYPLLSAAWFWDSKKLNDLADAGATEKEIAEITRKINGGYHGLEERSNQFDKFYEVLQ